MTHISVNLPRTPEEITAKWLSEALQSTDSTAVVRTVKTRDIIWGTTTKVMIEVEYANSHASNSPPNLLCVKGGFDPRVSGVSASEILVMEARFYGELRTKFNSSAPASYYAGISPSGDQGIVVMEDLSVGGTQFFQPGAALTVDLVAQILEQQAGWHSATWGARNTDVQKLPVGSQTRKAVKLFFREPHWTRHFSQTGSPVLPPGFEDPRRLYNCYRALWASDDASELCLQHGDAHVGNTYRRENGTPGFIDWQCYCQGPWSYDVSYFLGGALSIENRRSNERELLRHYLDALAAGGGPRIEWDDAWNDYVRHQLHGLLWAVTPSVMQPFDRSRLMADRHLAACVDHGTIAALEAK